VQGQGRGGTAGAGPRPATRQHSGGGGAEGGPAHQALPAAGKQVLRLKRWPPLSH
jgi:hypothetical protein